MSDLVHRLREYIATCSPLSHRLLVEACEEIERLKRGDFTEEEFQNLCHNFSEDDAERFRNGCEDYQRKLFGETRRIRTDA